ncbi:MAG TPA: hypothetical protein VIO60_04160 [Rectinemataceae bacterium]
MSARLYRAPYRAPRACKAAAALLLMFGALALGSCATTPKLPSWVTKTPPPDRQNTWFVGSGSGADAAAAGAAAANNLIASIMQYLGVTVKVTTSSTVKASLDSYSSDLMESIETQSDNRMAGFKIVERYLKTESSGLVTAYILASYLTSDLEAEKARIQALMQEKVDAVARPEAEGDGLAGQGRAVEAALKYIEAMAAAGGSDVDNAGVKLERNANKARAQIAQLQIRFIAGSELRGVLGKAPAGPVEIAATAGSPGSVPRPLAGVALSVSYPRKLPNGKLGTKTENLITDSAGIARLSLPPPDFAGKGKIYARLDLSSALELLDGLPKAFSVQVGALEDEASSKAAELSYVVTSAAASQAMSVFLVDLDDSGRPTSLGYSQAGLLEVLAKEGFQVRSLSLDPSSILAGQDSLAALARSAAPGVPRLLFGSCRILSVRKEGSLYLASASGTLKALELGTGRILYSADKSAQVLASDEASARRNALRELGASIFAKDLVSSLP